MRMRPVLVFSIVVGGCFAEGPEGEDPTGDEDTTSASDPSMTSTSTASTTTVDPVTTSATGDATATTDPTDMTMTTEDPTTDATTDADSSSTGEPDEEVFQDFLLEAGEALWTNDLAAVLDFPVYWDDVAAPNGHAYLVTRVDPVAIESTGETFMEDAMLLHPRFDVDGEVRGRYDGLVYMAGDRFRTHAYCVQDTGCSVELVLAHSIEQSDPAEITSFDITADDLNGVDIDFVLAGGGFAPGTTTELSLIVRAGPDSGSDSLLLHRPRIVRGE